MATVFRKTAIRPVPASAVIARTIMPFPNYRGLLQPEYGVSEVTAPALVEMIARVRSAYRQHSAVADCDDIAFLAGREPPSAS